MSLWVKICGLRSREAVQAAVEGGANALGFVFAESVRRVTPTEAAELAEAIPAGVLRVAVMRHPSQEDWHAVESEFRPDWLQTDAADFAALTLSDAVSRLPVFRDEAVDLGSNSTEMPAKLLYEGAVSGAGERADWATAASLARRTRLVLAGGLSAANVEEAIIRVAPWGVDVSTGVERAPGVKDPERIYEFIRTAKSAASDRTSVLAAGSAKRGSV